MRRAILLGSCLAIVGLSCQLALADLPGNKVRPRPPSRQGDQPEEPSKPSEAASKPLKVNFQIMCDKNATSFQLIVPASLLEKLQKEGDSTKGKTGWWDPNVRTMFAGVALSLAIASLVLLPRWKHSRAAMIVAVCALSAASAFSMCWANAPLVKSEADKEALAHVFIGTFWDQSTEVVVEKKNTENTIRYIIPRGEFDNFKWSVRNDGRGR